MFHIELLYGSESLTLVAAAATLAHWTFLRVRLLCRLVR